MGSWWRHDVLNRELGSGFRPRFRGRGTIFASRRVRRRNDYLSRVSGLIRQGASAVAKLRGGLVSRFAKRREVAFYRTQRATLKPRQTPKEILVSSEMIVEVYERFGK